MKELIKLIVDFNNTDKERRVRLITINIMNDLASQKIKLTSGLKVLLDDNDELTITGVVEFSESENIWVAKVDWNKFGSA